MGVMREAGNRVRSFFAKRQRDAELDGEIPTHLDLAVEEYMRQGMPRDEARRRALIRFGGVQQAKERHREARGLPWLDVLLQDVRYTLRTLRRDRSFSLIAVLILGLGIGANIAVFSVVNTILLRPLPFPHPEQLVRILTKHPTSGESSMTYSADATEEYQRRNHSLQDVSGYFAFSGPENIKLIGKDQPRPVTGLMVGEKFFHTLGVEPVIGRQFRPEECVHNGRPVALLSHAFWERQFAGNPALVGQTINLDGSAVTVIGVLPETFDFGSVFSPGARIDLYAPAILDDMRDWGNIMALVGRMKPGTTLAQAQAEADLLFPAS